MNSESYIYKHRKFPLGGYHTMLPPRDPASQRTRPLSFIIPLITKKLRFIHPKNIILWLKRHRVICPHNAILIQYDETSDSYVKTCIVCKRTIRG